MMNYTVIPITLTLHIAKTVVLDDTTLSKYRNTHSFA
jgi:hypothetical protein